MTFDELSDDLREFAADRGWLKFHTPQHLSRALMVEAAELAELYLWGRDPWPHRVEQELADVIIYAVRLADAAGVDLSRAIREKMTDNAKRVPLPDGTLAKR